MKRILTFLLITSFLVIPDAKAADKQSNLKIRQDRGILVFGLWHKFEDYNGKYFEIKRAEYVEPK